jgi:hypothetical protein
MSESRTTWTIDKGEEVEFTNTSPAPPETEWKPYLDLACIAEVGWAAQLAWEGVLNDYSSDGFYDITKEDRDAAVFLVKWLLDNPTCSISAQHDAWRAKKVECGWSYGDEKNYGFKTSPYLKPFDELTPLQQRKARLWRHIIFAMVG